MTENPTPELVEGWDRPFSWDDPLTPALALNIATFGDNHMRARLLTRDGLTREVLEELVATRIPELAVPAQRLLTETRPRRRPPVTSRLRTA